MPDPVSIQRDYYRSTAEQYDRMHLGDQEHEFALAFLISAINFLDIKSVLDIGSGTGRAVLALKNACPSVRVAGIEPSAELRERGYAKGLTAAELIDGDAQSITFRPGAFDLVCAFAVLHHVPDPRQAVHEMLRVAGRAVFISDANNFGQGSLAARSIKQAIRALGLWPLADFIKTGGRGYTISEGDGLAYSYSIFDDYAQIKTQCKTIHILNTNGNGPNLYRSASQIALLGIK